MTSTTAAAPPTPDRPLVSMRLRYVSRLLRQPRAIAAIGWILLLVLCSTFPWLLTTVDPLQQNLAQTLLLPSAEHPLGTDQLGRDVLARLIYGTAPSLLGALAAISIAVVVGVPAGLVAGYFGGPTDNVISRFTDMVMALPIIIVLMAVLAVFGNSMWIAMVAFGLLASAVLQRVVRASAQAVRTELFVDAARVSGVPSSVIVGRHVFPVVLSSVLVQGSLLVGAAILVGAGLTFLGLGTAPPAPSWGSMIKDASAVINFAPWLMVPPGVIIILTVVAFNALGDALRDAAPIALRGSQLRTPPRLTGRARSRRRGSEPSAVAMIAGRPNQKGNLLDVRNLCVGIDGPRGTTPIVTGVDLQLRRGEAVALVGESGCGKTMVALAMLGLLPGSGRITDGEILLDGLDLVGLTEKQYERLRGSRIGYVSQEPMVSLDPSFTVLSQLVEPLRAHKRISKKAAEARALELLELVGINRARDVARSYPHQISGGMAQRVAIALALTGDPELLIADEPTTALDVTVQAEILDLLRSLQESTGLSLLLVTHDLGVVADLCSRAVVMYAGEIVEVAAVDELFATPSHPYTRGLLDSIPRSAGAGNEIAAIAGSVPPPGTWPVGCRFAERCPFTEQRCRSAAIQIQRVGPGHVSRCVRAAEVSAAVGQ